MTDVFPDPARWHAALLLRAQLYSLFRDFFAQRGVLEVETPILSAGGNTEPNIDSFCTDFSGHVDAGARQRWLRTSPEYPLKRLLVAGIGDCYELGRVFRNGEAGRRHNPEFTMLEWYRLGMDHLQLAQETITLVGNAMKLVGRTPRVVHYDYRELFREFLGIDPFIATLEQLQAPLAEFSIDADGLVRDDWLDLLITHLIEPRLDDNQLTLLSDFPASQAALARIRPGSPPRAERFELFIGQHELANGYHELTDVTEQRTRLQQDNVRRRSRGQAELPIDENFLAALEHGLPGCAGVALGVERLLMAMTGSSDIAEVLAFAFARA